MITRTRLVIALLLVLFVAGLVLLIRINRSSGDSQDLQRAQVSSWDDIEPGISRAEDVQNMLGQPIGTGEQDNLRSLSFGADSFSRSHNILVDSDGVVVFAKEIITKNSPKKLSDLEATYGTPDYKLYGPEYVNYDFLFVNLDSGIAYLGNPKADSLLEIWYFKPMSLEEFLATWGKGYRIEPEPRF